jgi:hypothetical protein
VRARIQTRRWRRLPGAGQSTTPKVGLVVRSCDVKVRKSAQPIVRKQDLLHFEKLRFVPREALEFSSAEMDDLAKIGGREDDGGIGRQKRPQKAVKTHQRGAG